MDKPTCRYCDGPALAGEVCPARESTARWPDGKPHVAFDRIGRASDLASERPIIVCVLGENGMDVTNHGTTAEVWELDLGHVDLRNDDERTEWVTSERANVEQLPVGHPARTQVEQIIAGVIERHGPIQEN